MSEWHNYPFSHAPQPFEAPQQHSELECDGCCEQEIEEADESVSISVGPAARGRKSGRMMAALLAPELSAHFECLADLLIKHFPEVVDSILEMVDGDKERFCQACAVRLDPDNERD